MDAVKTLFEALAVLAWPMITAAVLWKLFPTLQGIVSTRGFTLEFGGTKISVQDATDQLTKQISDLQDQILTFRHLDRVTTQADHIEASAQVVPPLLARQHSILWVDDKPSNNAIEIAQLEERGFRVATALSTEEGLSALVAAPFLAVISDMGRQEDGKRIPQAGIQLLKEMRVRQLAMPFLVYTTRATAARFSEEVKALGGDGATASPIELLNWIRSASTKT